MKGNFMKKYLFFVLISTIVYSQDIQKNQKLDSLANIFSLEEVTVNALRAKDNTPVPFVNVTKKDFEKINLDDNKNEIYRKIL